MRPNTIDYSIDIQIKHSFTFDHTCENCTEKKLRKFKESRNAGETKMPLCSNFLTRYNNMDLTQFTQFRSQRGDHVSKH